jgi:lysophospholipase L1-like esterase
MKILFQGDSITAGYSWEFMVSGKLTGAWPHRFECVNRAVSGDTVLKMRDRWQADALDIRPDVLLMLVGINDCGRIVEGNMTLEEYGTVYRELIRLTRGVSPQLGLILLEPFLVSDDPKPLDILAEQRKTVREIADEEGAVFIPLHEEIVRRSAQDGMTYWTQDGVHLNRAGHWLVARKVLEAGAPLFGVDSAE